MHSARIAERETMALQAEKYLETVKRNAARYGETLAASGLTGDRDSVGVPRDDEKDLRNAMDRNSRLRSRRRAGIPTAQTKVNESLADGITGTPVSATVSIGTKITDQLVNVDTRQTDKRGAALARTAQVANSNTGARTESEFVRFDPPGKPLGTGLGMAVRTAGRGMALGAIYPIRANIDIRADGLCISRMTMVETPIKFAGDPQLNGVSRYEVSLFAKGVDAPVGTLEVTPEAFPDPNRSGRLKLANHCTKLRLGSEWNIPGAETITVTEADVEDVASLVPVWDARLMATIEATMWQLRVQDSSATAAFSG